MPFLLDLTTCPECGSVAEVLDRDAWPSTGGPVEHVRVRCVQRHVFCLPVASLPAVDTPAGVVRHAEGRAGTPL